MLEIFEFDLSLHHVIDVLKCVELYTGSFIGIQS